MEKRTLTKIISISLVLLAVAVLIYLFIVKSEKEITIIDGENKIIQTVTVNKRNAHLSIIKKDKYLFKGYFTEPDGNGEMLVDEDGYVVGKYSRFDPNVIYPYMISIYDVSSATKGKERDGYSFTEYITIPDDVYRAMIENQEEILKIDVSFKWRAKKESQNAKLGMVKSTNQYSGVSTYFDIREGLHVSTTYTEYSTYFLVNITDLTEYKDSYSHGYSTDRTIELKFIINSDDRYTIGYIQNLEVSFSIEPEGY